MLGEYSEQRGDYYDDYKYDYSYDYNAYVSKDDLLRYDYNNYGRQGPAYNYSTLHRGTTAVYLNECLLF